MLREIFEALSIFDWISPAKGISRALDGDKPISVRRSLLSPCDYEDVLKSRGIKTTSRTIVAGKGFVVTVPEEDYETAIEALEKAGAPLAYK